MSYYLRSIQDEYDDKGSYIGNSEGGNRFHGIRREPDRPGRKGRSDEELTGINREKEPIEVKHADLERLDPLVGGFQSFCPVCLAGTLLVRRDPETLEIVSEDNCILCGQRFVYTDLGEDS